MVLSVDNDSFIEGLGSQAVFHSSHDLKFIFIESAYVSNGCICELGVFVLILFNECACHVGKLKFVVLGQVHTVTVLDRSNIVVHHQWELASLFSRFLVYFRQLLQTYAGLG